MGRFYIWNEPETYKCKYCEKGIFKFGNKMCNKCYNKKVVK